MDLLANAIEAIENGIDDFSNGEPTRTSSSIRNLFAGLLLMLKEKLRRESPPDSNEVLIHAQIVPKKTSSGLIFIGTGSKTIDFNEIHQRFDNLGLSLDWKRLERLQKLRNEIEHHKTAHPDKILREAIANVFVLLLQLMEDHLAIRPKDVFKKKTWDAMLSEAQTQKELSDRCRKSIETLPGIPDAVASLAEELSCPECESSLLRVEIAQRSYFGASVVCQVCKHTADMTDLVPVALRVVYAYERYRAAKDGDEDPIGTCPECCCDSYLLEEDRCLLCGESRQYTACNICGSNLTLDDQEHGGICSYHAYVLNKDD